MIDAKSSHINTDGVTCTIARTTPYSGKMIVARMKSSNSDYTVGNRRLINALLESNLATGEIVSTTDESYLCVVSKKELIQGQEASIIAHGLLCNATLTVTRDTTTYDADGNPTGSTPSTIINAAHCRADVVTAKLREVNKLLLDSTVLVVYAKYDSGLLVLDKAAVAGNDYRVDSINTLEIPGAMVVQLSKWVG